MSVEPLAERFNSHIVGLQRAETWQRRITKIQVVTTGGDR